MKKLYDAVCSVGTYKDKKTGQEKVQYLKVGTVLEGDKGISLKLDSIPVNFNGWINFYEPKEKQQKQEGAEPKDPFDDDVGF